MNKFEGGNNTAAYLNLWRLFSKRVVGRVPDSQCISQRIIQCISQYISQLEKQSSWPANRRENGFQQQASCFDVKSKTKNATLTPDHCYQAIASRTDICND